MIKEFTFWSTHFLKTYCVTVNLKKFSSNTIFRWNTFWKFYFAKFKYFSKSHDKVKKKFWNFFWLATMLVILEMKKSLASIKKSLYHCNPP